MINLALNFIKHVQSLRNAVCASEPNVHFSPLAMVFYAMQNRQWIYQSLFWKELSISVFVCQRLNCDCLNGVGDFWNFHIIKFKTWKILTSEKVSKHLKFTEPISQKQKPHPSINSPLMNYRLRLLKIVNHINCNQFFYLTSHFSIVQLYDESKM